MGTKHNDATVPLWDHPEFREALDGIGAILDESDRGAVLIAASNVDSSLRRAFEGLAPGGMSKARVRRLVEYPGPLSSLSGKAEVAFLIGLIGRTTFEAIDALRRLRNAVAHSGSHFGLSAHLTELASFKALGPGVPQAINELAAKMLIHSFVANALESDAERVEAERLFESPWHVLDELLKRKEAVAVLQAKAYRAEVGLASAFMVYLLAIGRDRFVATRGAAGDPAISFGPAPDDEA